MTSSLSWKYAITELEEVFDDVGPINVMEDDEFYHDGNRVSVVPVTSIDYSEGFRIAFGYFRAIFRSQEISARTLKLTATCLHLNPANYTVWHYRRKCLQSLHLPLNANDKPHANKDWSYIKDDLDMAASLGGDNPKNYQIWYHRRAMLEQLPRPEFMNIAKEIELEYINAVLRIDAKNYHAWSHRQWVISAMVQFDAAVLTSTASPEDSANALVNDFRVALWDSELVWVGQIIEEDVRNNSAWNYRWYITHNRNITKDEVRCAVSNALSVADASTEMEYALQMIAVDPYNESPVKYFTALLKAQVCSLNDKSGVQSLLSNAESRLEEIENNHLLVSGKIDVSNSDSEILDVSCERRQPSIYLLCTLVDVLEWKGDSESLCKAIELMESLATQYDVVRKSYWHYRTSRAEEQLQNCLTVK